MISIVKLKKYIAGTSIFGIIIGKLYYKKKLYLIILFEVNKSLKVGFYYTILPLNLAIYLQVKGNKEFLFNIRKII